MAVDVKIRCSEDAVRGSRVVGGTGLDAATERGRRTRSALVKAARDIFERDGYLEARIADIAKRAKVAYGTFYTYFSSKEEVSRAVVSEVQIEQLGMGSAVDLAERPNGPFSRIEAANRAYLNNYRRNARILAVLEQLCTFSDDWRHIRLELRRPFVVRASLAISLGCSSPGVIRWCGINPGQVPEGMALA